MEIEHGFDEFLNKSHKYKDYEISVQSQPTASKGLSDDIVDELISYFSEKLVIEDCCGGRNLTMDPYNIWTRIFSSVERTDFVKWIQTLPKEMVKKITESVK